MLTSKSKDMKDKNHGNEKNNKLMLEKALGDIRKFRADINKYLDEVKADAISEAKRTMSDNDKLLTKQAQDCKELSSKLETMNEMLNTELYEENVTFITYVALKPKVTELEQEITLAHSKKKHFEFACNQQLRDFAASSKKLGEIVISTVSHCQTTKIAEGRDEKTGKAASKNENSFDMKDKVVNQEKKALVGARVEYNAYWAMDGTVTVVHPDGRVNVEWDDGWSDVGPFTVGTGHSNVTLI